MLYTDIMIKSHPLGDGTMELDTLTSLINKAFKVYGKELDPNYWNTILGYNPTVYLAVNQNDLSVPLGGAITYKEDNYEYMCKLFVDPHHQGNGVARKIIHAVHIDKVKMAWRTQIEENPAKEQVIHSYEKLTHKLGGIVKNKGEYNIYLVNISEGNMEGIMDKISKKPSTLISR